MHIAQSTATMLNFPSPILDSEVILDARFNAGIYGLPDAQTLAAIKLAAETEAFITDQVYEGKSMAGLIELVKSGEIGKESNVLYIHLGGQNALKYVIAFISASLILESTKLTLYRFPLRVLQCPVDARLASLPSFALLLLLLLFPLCVVPLHLDALSLHSFCLGSESHDSREFSGFEI